MTSNAEKRLANAQLPMIVERNEKRVNQGFWKKIRKYISKIPFIEDLLAAYYCAFDTNTPSHVRATLLAALAYFVLPIDMIPDFLLAFGFGDDATVLAAAIAVVRGHLTDTHYAMARKFMSENGLKSVETEE